jgi:hypothetical protein
MSKHRAQPKPSILRRLTVGLSVVVVALGVVTVATGRADAADQRACVTAGEWSQIHKRMTKGRVEQILDSKGFRSYQTFTINGTDEWRGYRPCRGFGTRYLMVWYDNYSFGDRLRVWDHYRSGDWSPR